MNTIINSFVRRRCDLLVESFVITSQVNFSMMRQTHIKLEVVVVASALNYM